MVLAAGLGTRLWPLTCDRAKPAVPFLGRPVIVGILDLLARHGCDVAVVNTHHLPRSIHRAVEGVRGVEIRFSHEEEIMGTAGALALALERGLLEGARETLVVNAKLVTDIDLGAVVAAHRASGCEVTMVLRPSRDGESFRGVQAEAGRVTGFVNGGGPLLFTGVHVISARVLCSIPRAFGDTVRDVYPSLIEAGEVAARVESSGRWWELSTPERYLGHHLDAFSLGLGPDPALSPGARVMPGAEVRRAVLWENATVEPGAVVDSAVLGAGVVVRSGERVERAIVVRREVVDEAGRGEPWGDRLRVSLCVASGR